MRASVRRVPVDAPNADSTRSAAAGGVASGHTDFTPREWKEFFQKKRNVQVKRTTTRNATTTDEEDNETDEEEKQTDSFCVYTSSPSAADSSIGEGECEPPFLVVLLHGGGQSSMAWACTASLLRPAMHLLAFDMRGHGGTYTSEDSDLSIDRLVEDVINVIHTLHSKPPPILLIGHSLGGAVAIRVTVEKKLPIAGLIVIDLVEGSAVSSMSHMVDVLQSRPDKFHSIQEAIQWALVGGAIRNIESARVSIPDQLIKVVEDHTAVASTSSGSVSSSSPATSSSSSSSSPPVCYRWRTDLLASQPYWSDWFSGLSVLFLSCALPKLLVLAGSDRLDTPMMIAHMQGKLQLELVGSAGHSVQEDQPKEMARRIAQFVHRHRLQSMGAAWAKQAAEANSNTTPAHAHGTPVTAMRPPVPGFHE